MWKLFTEDEFHPMARALDESGHGLNPGEGAAQAGSGGGIAPALQAPGIEVAAHDRPPVARHVCPFCGSLNESPQGACPRCAMENTPQIRNATKARIGPWYVLQTRNPAAPGMRFDTMLAFVRKGRIKPKSVVRGPTTHQLWRHAYQVKGLSREFGVCYSCAGTIDKNAKVCGRCNRLQDPPANPDVLLENEEGAGVPPVGGAQPIYKEIKTPANDDIVIPPLRAAGKPAAAGATPTPVSSPVQTDAPAPAVSVADPAADPIADDHPSIAANVFALDDPHEPAREVSSAAATSAGENGNSIFSASELAAAFRLNVGSAEGDNSAYAAVSDGSGATVRMPGILARDLPPMYVRRRSPGKIFATFLFVASLCVALWMILDNSARDKAVTWFTESFNAMRRTTNNTSKSRLPDADQPDVTEGGISPSDMGDPGIPDPASDPRLRKAPASAVDPLPVDVGVKAPKPAATQVTKPDPEFPVTVPEDLSAQGVATPPKAPDAPAPIPAPTPTEPVAGGTDDETPALKAQRAGAMTMFRQANDAMQGKNFGNAARIYEQIKQKYPKEAWPGGLDLKLKLAKRSAGEP